MQIQIFSIRWHILPGGESSVQYDYCINNNLDKKIKEFALVKPILGTCAGTILLSKYKSSHKWFWLIDINIKEITMADK